MVEYIRIMYFTVRGFEYLSPFRIFKYLLKYLMIYWPLLVEYVVD